jgi:hypothetical protein
LLLFLVATLVILSAGGVYLPGNQISRRKELLLEREIAADHPP